MITKFREHRLKVSDNKVSRTQIEGVSQQFGNNILNDIDGVLQQVV